MRRPRSRTGLCPSKVKLTSSTPWRCAAAPKAASVPVAPPLKRMQSSRLTSAPPRGRSLRLHACGQTDALPAAPPRRPRPAWRAPHLVGRARRVRSPDWRALPVVVGRPARLVHLPEGELDGQVELHFPGARVGHLEVKARAVDVDHGRDERRARAPRSAAAIRSGANAAPALPTFPKSGSCAWAGSKPSSRTSAPWLRASGP